MKKLFVFLISLFVMNSMAGQDLNPARLFESVAQRNHNPFNILGQGSNPRGEVLFMRGTKNQPSMIQIHDSIYNWNCGLPDMEWMVDSKTTDIVYDARNNLASEIYMVWSDTAWEMRIKYNYTYDIANNLICELVQEWNGIAWDNVSQDIYTYDAWNNQISELDQEWNGISWENVSQYTYEYDNNHNQISALIQEWDSSAWENTFLITYTYDTAGNLISLLAEGWDGSAWVNSILETCTYDTVNNPVSYLVQLWIGNAWINNLLVTFMYDTGNNQVYELAKGWNGFSWIDEWQYIYSYDANDNLISVLIQTWEGTRWLNESQLLYTYETNNFKLSETWYDWDESGTAISYGDSTYYYFHMLGIDRHTTSMKNITVYPNPTSTRLNIETTSGGELTILNCNGQAILRQDITGPVATLDVSGLSTGVYMLKIVGKESVQVGKFVKK